MQQGHDANPFDAAMQHYKARRLPQAEAALRRLTRRPDTGAHAAQLLGMLLIETGKFQQAVYELERALKQDPRSVDLLMTLHFALKGCGEPDRALATATAALEIAPRSDAVMLAIASLHVSQYRHEEAERWYHKAREANPQNVQVILGLAALYSASLRGVRTVELLREAIASGLHGLDILRLLAFRLQYVSGVDPSELFEAHRVAGQCLAREANQTPPRLNVDATPDRTLTIGLLSPDFRQHACAHFIEPLLEARNRKTLRVVAYSNLLHPDATTARIRLLCDEWRETATMQDTAVSQQIVSDRVDIAIDLAGHTAGSRLGSLVSRPAPITASFIGYPNTTGVPGIDYRFVDSVTDPPGAEAFATEQLVRLHPCFLCYRPAIDAPEVSPPPFERAGHVTFGSFNILDKVSDATLDLWAEILRKVPTSRLLLKSRSIAAEPSIVGRVHAAFERRGVGAGRVELIGSTTGIREHLGLYARVDIALDTAPYNGTTTTCEAMWMGVPVVTMRGAMHAGRVGASLVSAVGINDLIGEGSAGYVSIAAALAADADRLRLLRSELRGRVAASPLRNERAYAAGFERTIRELWRAWCSSRSGG